MRYYTVTSATLNSTPEPRAGMILPADYPQAFLPPLITELHQSFAAWGRAGYAPGPLHPLRVWFNPQGELAFAREGDPQPATGSGIAQDLAAWLTLLDGWMETFVVIARARAVWSVAELAGALSFTTPAYLPRAVMEQSPESWLRVAQALATAVADGPLQGEAQNRHWQEQA
ncbi:MAG: hypothetical protein H6642_14740 [Caldilineaceae bacterium]|nr:hypothetical protein [Caldilineaceae bacterium]